MSHTISPGVGVGVRVPQINKDFASLMLRDFSVGLQLIMCFFRVLCLLDDLRGDATDPVSFRTPPCEPDAPSPPKLHARTVNCITLKWNVCSDLIAFIIIITKSY